MGSPAVLGRGTIPVQGKNCLKFFSFCWGPHFCFIFQLKLIFGVFPYIWKVYFENFTYIHLNSSWKGLTFILNSIFRSSCPHMTEGRARVFSFSVNCLYFVVIWIHRNHVILQLSNWNVGYCRVPVKFFRQIVDKGSLNGSNLFVCLFVC